MDGFEIKDYSAIVSGIITAFSTLSAVLITNYFHLRHSKQSLDVTHERDRTQRKLEKIEEFYLLFERWEINLSNIYLYHLRAYRKRLTYSQVLEATSKKDNFLPADAQKLQMLLNIYIPELISEYEKVDSARSKIVPYIMDDPEHNGLSAEGFVKLQEDFEITCKIFKEKISKLSHGL